MTKQNYVPLICVIGITILSLACTSNKDLSQDSYEDIIDAFKQPTSNNNLWCYWYWINDDISKDGVTKDLEAMKKAGIGAALIGNINPAQEDGKVPLFSEEWWDIMVHAVNEGKRLGVDIGVFNCPGWSQSGGPWVKANMAMRYLNYSKTEVKGPATINLELEKPNVQFEDTYTIAYKDKGTKMPKPTITGSHTPKDLKALSDNDTATIYKFSIAKKKELTLNYRFDEPVTARNISLHPAKVPFTCRVKVYAGYKGKDSLIKVFQYDRSNYKVTVGPITKGPLVISLPEINSNNYKVVCSNFTGRRILANNKMVSFSEISLNHSVMLEKYIEKQLGKMHPTPLPNWNTYVWPRQEGATSAIGVIHSEDIIDISDKVNEKGELNWEVPEGTWKVLRFGMTPTGTKNAPSAPQGRGYEVDKMSSELVKVHFENFIGELLKRIPEESKPAFKYVIADSYEMGSQNWTNGYAKKFKAKFGYDPVKYLPVLSGKVVGSVEESERFLWDLRRSVADDVAYEYVGGLRKISNEHNLKLWLENYGHWGFPSEFLMYGGQSDLVSGEFWNEGKLGNIECKASSSAAHIYGKPKVSAEAFTASRKTYKRHPALLKRRGDWSFTEGINHIVLHLYIQQPDDSRIPGMNAWFSTEFNRHNTWFSQAHTYFDYLRRCQHLLQQGKYVADVCYFIGENAPIMTGGRVPEIPAGYSYDYINAEVIVRDMQVKDGKFILPNGMAYKVMVLPPFTTMRPELLGKLEQLVREGGVVLGNKPEKSPSLQGYPQCDNEVKELAGKLWAGEYANNKMAHNYGKGLVLSGYNLNETFKKIDLAKDVDLAGTEKVLWTHRTMPGMEVYFLSNQENKEISISPTFRVSSNLKPQLWNAITGEIKLLTEFELTDKGVKVPLKMEGHRSWFVVFTENTSSKLGKSSLQNFPDYSTLLALDAEYEVDFENKAIGPKSPQQFTSLLSWAESDNDKVKYYSGTANYKTRFTMPEFDEDKAYFLNLGKVGVMAKVKINGKYVGGVWMAPYRLNITPVIQKGENQLEVEVVNLWRNRLVYDKGLSQEKRYTWLVIDKDIKKKEKLLPSGLLGPVTIETIEYNR